MPRNSSSRLGVVDVATDEAVDTSHVRRVVARQLESQKQPLDFGNRARAQRNVDHALVRGTVVTRPGSTSRRLIFDDFNANATGAGDKSGACGTSEPPHCLMLWPVELLERSDIQPDDLFVVMPRRAQVGHRTRGIDQRGARTCSTALPG